MHGQIRWLRPLLAAALVGGAGGVWTASASADSILLKSGTNTLTLPDVHVSRIENDSVYFTAAQSDTEDSRPVSSVIEFKLDDEPAFTAAEDAFAKQDWKGAVDNYRKAITATSKGWVKTRSSVRLMEAAANSGNFADAVTGFIAMADRDPALAAAHRPDPSNAKPADIDGAIAQVKSDLDSGNAKPEEQKVLLPFLAELYTKKGDGASAEGVLDQEAKIDPAASGSPLVKRARASIALGQASDLVKQSKWQDAENLIESHEAVFFDPPQQADALYILAQAKEGLASPDNPDSLKDAATAYMRVVAINKDLDGMPHVADAMLKAAAIEEKLKKPDEALLLYQRVNDTFKDSQPDVAQQAAGDVQRLQAARTGH